MIRVAVLVACMVCLLHATLGAGHAPNQRYRVVIKKDPKLGLGIRLVKLKEKIIILDIVPDSPAAMVPGGTLSVGDAIAAVNQMPVPPNSLA